MDTNNVIAYLNNSNQETKNTLIDGFINDKTIQYLPLYVLETFAINKEAQLIIMNLSIQHLKNISNIIKYSENINQDWIPLCANYYHFLNNKRYDNLVNDINNIDLDSSLVESLLFVIENGGNYFNINSINDLKDLRNKRISRAQNIHDTKDPKI